MGGDAPTVMSPNDVLSEDLHDLTLTGQVVFFGCVIQFGAKPGRKASRSQSTSTRTERGTWAVCGRMAHKWLP